MGFLDYIRNQYKNRINEAKAAGNFVKQIPNYQPFGEGTEPIGQGLKNATIKTFSREGLGSVGGIREASKGITRGAMTLGKQFQDLQPSTYLARKVMPKQFAWGNRIYANIDQRLAPRGTDAQQAANIGFKFSTEMSPYGAIEGAAVKALSNVPRLAKVASSPAGRFALRRVADVVSGQMLTPVKTGLKDRLAQAGMDIVGGSAMEGAGKIVKPSVKAVDTKISLRSAFDKLGKEAPARVPMGEGATIYNTKSETQEVPNYIADFFFRNKRFPKPNEVTPDVYTTRGTTELRFNDGKFVGWDSDSDAFKAKIAQESGIMGLSTADISGGQSLSTNKGTGGIEDLYHQTSPEIASKIEKDGFKITNGVSRQSDSVMPDAVFLKTTPDEIPLSAKGSQMKVSGIGLKNTKTFADRAELENFLRKDAEYNRLKNLSDQSDKISTQKYAQLETNMDKMTQQQIDDAIRGIDVADKQATTIARNRATQLLKEQGLDAIIVKNDTKVAGGKGIETVAVLNPDKVTQSLSTNKGTVKPPTETPTINSNGLSGKPPSPPVEPPKPPMGDLSVPPANKGIPTDPVEKIVTALKQAKPLRKEQNVINAEMRKQKYAKLMSTRSKEGGEQGYFKELGALKGGAPKVDFESIRPKLEQGDIDTLFNRINDSNVGDWEKVNAKAGLMKLLTREGGSMPTRGELKLLNDVFGKEMTDAILSNQTTWQKFLSGAGEVLNLPRALMASFDLSAPLRQGVVMTSRPKQFFPAFVSMFKQAGSDKAFRAVQEEIAARPTYKLMRESKLALTDIGGDLAGREEMFMSNLGEKIPLVKYGIKASNRAYTGFLNKMRADVFDDMVKKATALGRNVDEVAPDIAKFVNSATGRGDLGALNKAAPVLNSIFFSPRLMASRVNMLNPIYYAKLDPMVRKEAIKSMLTMGAVAGTALGLAKAGGAEVETDSKSADFGKIKVGDTRYDILGGFQQYIVLASRLLSGKMTSSTTGKEISLTEGYKPTTRQDIIINFLKSKENPILSYMTGFLDQTNQMGQQFNAGAEAINRFIPMFAQDIVDLTEDKGLVKALGMELPSAFGVGVQTYGRQMPVIGTSPAGNSTIKWRNPYDIGERIVNKITGQGGSPFSKEEQYQLDQTRRSEQRTKADTEKVISSTQKKINKGEVVKGVTTLPDGRGMYVTDKGIQYANTPEEAQKKLNQNTFDKSGKRSDWINDVYYSRKANGELATPLSRDEYNYKDVTAKMNIATNNDDYKTWTTLAKQKLTLIENQIDNADPLTQQELLNDYQDLQTKIAKYQGYGGFKKGKSKKTKFAKLVASTKSLPKTNVSLRSRRARKVKLNV